MKACSYTSSILDLCCRDVSPKGMGSPSPVAWPAEAPLAWLGWAGPASCSCPQQTPHMPGIAYFLGSPLKAQLHSSAAWITLSEAAQRNSGPATSCLASRLPFETSVEGSMAHNLDSFHSCLQSRHHRYDARSCCQQAPEPGLLDHAVVAWSAEQGDVQVGFCKHGAHMSFRFYTRGPATESLRTPKCPQAIFPWSPSGVLGFSSMALTSPQPETLLLSLHVLCGQHSSSLHLSSLLPAPGCHSKPG